MNITINKGPLFRQVENDAYRYLNKALRQSESSFKSKITQVNFASDRWEDKKVREVV